jgi:uncharacterized protein YjiS (DUF1127 family)
MGAAILTLPRRERAYDANGLSPWRGRRRGIANDQIRGGCPAAPKIERRAVQKGGGSMNRLTSTEAHPAWLSAARRAVSGLLRQVGSVLRAIDDRREVLNLAELDDHTLKDIGLLRSDVEGALSEPFFRSPSLVLVRKVDRRDGLGARAGERRAGRPVVPLVKAARGIPARQERLSASRRAPRRPRGSTEGTRDADAASRAPFP